MLPHQWSLHTEVFQYPILVIELYITLERVSD